MFACPVPIFHHPGGGSRGHQELRDASGGGFRLRLLGGREGDAQAGAAVSFQRPGEATDQLRGGGVVSYHRARGLIVS